MVVGDTEGRCELLLLGGALMRIQVSGEVGARLNYDGLVVYNNGATRSSYLVVYDIPC